MPAIAGDLGLWLALTSGESTLRDEVEEAVLPAFDVAFDCVRRYYEALPW